MTISKETVEQLIHLSSIRQKPMPCNINLTSEVIHAGISNGLAAWCYTQYKSGILTGISEDAFKEWKSIYFHNTIQYQRYLAVYAKVGKLLKNANIPVMALKGLALASSLYPDDGLRPMGDIDILVSEGRGMEALAVLLNNGAEPLVVPRSEYHELADAHVRAIKVDGVMVEIHQRLFTLGSSYHTPEINFFEHTTKVTKQDVEVVRLNDVMMAYHLVAHAIKGIEMGGLRLGWLLDVALLLNSVEDSQAMINQVIDIRPQKKGNSTIFAMCLPFTEAADDTSAKLDRSSLEEITRMVNEHDHSKEHRMINLMHLLKTPGLSTKFKLLFYEFFPQKAYMQFRYQSMANEPLWRMYLKRIVRR